MSRVPGDGLDATPRIASAIGLSLAGGGVPVVLTEFTDEDESSLIAAAVSYTTLESASDCMAYIGPEAAWIVILFGDGGA